MWIFLGIFVSILLFLILSPIDAIFMENFRDISVIS